MPNRHHPAQYRTRAGQLVSSDPCALSMQMRRQQNAHTGTKHQSLGGSLWRCELKMAMHHHFFRDGKDGLAIPWTLSQHSLLLVRYLVS